MQDSTIRYQVNEPFAHNKMIQSRYCFKVCMDMGIIKWKVERVEFPALWKGWNFQFCGSRFRTNFGKKLCHNIQKRKASRLGIIEVSMSQNIIKVSFIHHIFNFAYQFVKFFLIKITIAWICKKVFFDQRILLAEKFKIYENDFKIFLYQFIYKHFEFIVKVQDFEYEKRP